jgi:hypothetical protein
MRAAMGGIDALVGYVGRIQAPVRSKLLAAFLLIELLLVALGAIGLLALREVEQRAGDLASLQHKIDAYRQMQHDTLRQLYGVSAALAAPDSAALSSALRQVNQFGYHLDRVAFVAKDEVALLGRVREEYARFIAIATRVLELTGAGRTSEARQVQTAELAPLADRLERLTNQLVNRAEADMVNGVDASRATYETSRVYVVAFALAGFSSRWHSATRSPGRLLRRCRRSTSASIELQPETFRKRSSWRTATNSARSLST